MSAAIEFCAGTVHVFRQGNGGAGGVGYYKLDPDITIGGGGRCLIVGAPTQLQELVSPVATLDDKRLIYVFGSSWTEMFLHGKLLLGPIGSRGAVESLLDWYESGRLSRRMAPLNLSAGKRGMEVFLTGARLDAANAEFNTQDFTLSFHMRKG